MLTVVFPSPTVHKSHETTRSFEWILDKLVFFLIVIREYYFKYDQSIQLLFPELEDPDFVAYLAQQYELTAQVNILLNNRK